MSDNSKKIEMKINRYIKQIGRDDIILDNGSCIQVITQNGVRVGYYHTHAPLEMGKKRFIELKKNGFIVPIDKENLKINRGYDKEWLLYYRFDIDKMLESGKYTEMKGEK